MRTHAAQLPTNDEVLQMMSKEAKREPVTAGHFADFSVAKEWLLALDIQSNLFEMQNIDDLYGEAERVKPSVVEKTLEKFPLEVLHRVENYLDEEDKLEKADIAIVFGGRTLQRAEKGAQLYLDGYVQKLLMTGRSPNYTSFFDVPEAEAFSRRAMDLGVPEQDIFVEPNAINIPDNVRSSLNLLDEKNFNYSSVIQVISWYANRRAWCTLKKYLRPDVRLTRVNVPLPNDSKYKQGEWYATSVGIEIVFNEFVKMRSQVLTERA